MLIEDPKLDSNFRGPAIDNTDDLNDTKTEDTSAKYVKLYHLVNYSISSSKLYNNNIRFCICGILLKT